MRRFEYLLFLIALSFFACSKDGDDDNVNSGDAELCNIVDISKDTIIVYKGPSMSVAKELSKKPLNLKNVAAWICFEDIYKETLLNSTVLKHISYNGKPVVNGENVEVLNYYGGTYIRPIPTEGYTPVYLNHSTVDKTIVVPNKIYVNDEIPVGNNKITEFYLKRGYMIVLAENPDGTGESNIYMAIDHDCEFQLDPALSGKVSFMRVTPWNYVSKRGTGGNPNNDYPKVLGTQWFYNWGDATDVTCDFVPMIWGIWGDINELAKRFTQREGINHLLTFNEPDNKDQANMTVDVAVERYKYVPATGLRLCSPACCEGVWKTWLSDFVDGCNKNKYRVDVIAIHWYDWGNYCATADVTPNVDQVVKRFQNDIENCYNKYKKPIWITEFNANVNRPESIHNEFLKKIIPWLEENPHVERYAYFEERNLAGYLVPGTKTLSATGQIYTSVKSTPSVVDNNPNPKKIIDR